MSNSHGRSRTASIVAALAALTGTGAQAAETTTVNALEEIIVTAQKRVENLQDTPIAITALSATDIEDRGISNARDLIGAMPGITGYEAPGSRGTFSVNLRGISSGNPSSVSND